MTRNAVMAALDALTAGTTPEGRPALVVQLSTKVAAAAFIAAVPTGTNNREAQDADPSQARP